MASALACGRSRDLPVGLADPLLATAQQLSTPSFPLPPFYFIQTPKSFLIERVQLIVAPFGSAVSSQRTSTLRSGLGNSGEPNFHHHLGDWRDQAASIFV
ncbi:hypothetical protein N7453_010535 [Penicillium expansum]|nr:hypothetical protein N7453_010535 [Penicillium expansum]